MSRMMGSLKMRLWVVLWGVGIVPVSAVGVFSCWSLGHNLQKQAVADLAAAAQTTARLVEAWAVGHPDDPTSAVRSAQAFATDGPREARVRCWLLTATEAMALNSTKDERTTETSALAHEKGLRAAIDQIPAKTPAGSGSPLTYRAAQGREVLAYAYPLPALGWTVVTEVDKAQVLENVRGLTWTILGIGAGAVIGVLGIGSWVSRRFADPLVGLTEAIHRLAKGDLKVTIPIEGPDETRALARGLCSVVEATARIVTGSAATADQIAAVRSEILSSCEQQASSALHQSAAVSETTSAAAQLSKTSEQIGENIKTISQMAGHVLTGMEKIKQATDQTNRILTSLNEKSKQIGNITELIDDVADQTNLLAVNASIEAARAGEQGRGFTVVADQIGKLADSTAKSTKDITALVEMIRHEMSNAIVAMEQSLLGVEEEIQLAKESAARSKEIAMSANQQISGSRQIAEAMSSIDETMKEIASGAQRSADAAGQLTTLADELKASMRRFKVTDHV